MFRQLFAILVISCTLTLPVAAQQAAPLKVVTTFSILGDLVRQVGGENVAITTLVGSDQDMHSYSIKPSDMTALKEADVIFANGLGLDTWINKAAASVNKKPQVFVVSSYIVPLAAEEDGNHQYKEGDAVPAADPHAWQDVNNTRQYINRITEILSDADKEHAALYQQRATDYLAALTQLENDIITGLGAIPRERRIIATSHDAFGYFAHAYDITILPISSINTDVEPSAASIAKLIRQIREQNIKTIFIENISNPRTAESIAAEAGAGIGGKLYSDALSGPDGPASTYVDMMRYNLKTILAGLKSPARR